MGRLGRHSIAIAIATLAAPTLAACSLTTEKAPPSCAELVTAGTPPRVVSSDTVVLIDRTASMRSGTGDGAAAWTERLLDELVTDFGLPEGRLVSIGAFDGSAATVSWWKPGAALTEAAGAAESVRKDREAARECLREDVRSALAAGSRTAGTDVLGAWQAARGRMVSGAGRKRLVVLTDGLANAGCGDIRQTAMGSPGQGATTARACGDQLPALAGVEVRLVGIGQTADPAQRLSSAELSWLTGYWQQLCEATAAACSVDSQTAAEGTAGAVAPAPPQRAEADPAVRFPRVTVVRNGRTWIWNLPASLLFDTASAQLSDRARTELGRVAAEIRRLPVESVTVVGHTDSRGTDADNEDLSERRAGGVSRFLRDAKIGPVRAEGRGERLLRCAPETTADGRPDEGKLACNRRVEIVVRTRGQA